MNYEDIITLCEEQANIYDVKRRCCSLADNYTNNWPCGGDDDHCCMEAYEKGCHKRCLDFLEAVKFLKRNYSEGISW